MPKYPGISPYDNEKGTLGTAKKRWEKLYVKEIESDTVSGMEAEIENLATTAENSVSAAVSAKNDAVAAKTAAQAAQTAAETAAAGIQSVVETDVDNTLSIAGVAADAKVTGDWLRDIAKPVTLDTSMPATAYADEYMKVTTDSEGRVLYGVKRDGTFTWQKGVPKHVQDKINELAAPTIDNDEYMYVMLDSEGRVLFGVKKDGSFDWQKGVPKPVKEKLEEVAQTVIQSDEFVQVILDNNGKVLYGIKSDGSFYWQKGIPLHLKQYIENTSQRSVLTGVRWVAFGDSQTAKRNGVMMYWEHLAKQTGIIPFDYGRGGSGYRNQIGSETSYYNRIQTLNPDDFDVCTIMGSRNDYGHTLGEITDTTTETVFGCMNLTIEAYMDIAAIHPLAIVTSFPYGGSDRTEEKLAWFEEYVAGQRAIAAKYNLPFVDNAHAGGIISWNQSFVDKYYSDNGRHVNSEGQKCFLAPRFRQLLLNMVWE